MIHWILKIFSWIFKQQVWAHEKKELKKSILRIYMKSIEGLRLSTIGLLSLIIALQMLVFGFWISLGVGLYFLPIEFETKILVLGIVGGVSFVGLGIFLVWALSSRVWFRVSGSQKTWSSLS